MNRRLRILLLRVSFLLGAIIDAIAAIQLMLPEVWINFYGLSAQPSPILTYALATGAALMWGWTALLIWADRKPLERKGVLLLTVIPVVGLALSNVYAAVLGLSSIQLLVPTLALECGLAVLFLFSYFNARKEVP